MEIRPLRETDSRLAVSRIYEESWRAAYRGMVPQAYLDGIPAGHWTEALDRADRTALVMLDGGKPAGTAAVSPSRWPEHPEFGEIVSLYLLPEYIGRGYGRPLLEAAVRELEGRGFRDILLWVLEENRRARRFYEKHGFRFGGPRMESAVGGKRNCCTAAVRRPAGPFRRTAAGEVRPGGACREGRKGRKSRRNAPADRRKIPAFSRGPHGSGILRKVHKYSGGGPCGSAGKQI